MAKSGLDRTMDAGWDGSPGGASPEGLSMPFEGSMRAARSRRSGARRPRPSGWLTAGLILAAAAGCRRDEVTHFRVPKTSPAPALAAMAETPGAPAAGEVPPPPTPGGALRWKLPAGWTEAQGGGPMRYATLKPPVPGKVDVTVIVLPGAAGGELANVNRWRNQIGLPPADEAGLAAARKTLRTGAGDVSVYDFASEGQVSTRTVAGLALVEGSSWFIKMTGDSSAVGAARPAFLELLGSLRRDVR